MTHDNVEVDGGLHAGIIHVERGLGGQVNSDVGVPQSKVAGNVEEAKGRKKKGKWKRWAHEGGVRGMGSDVGF